MSSQLATGRGRFSVSSRTVRRIALAEATSFLLLFICMIFKYTGPRNGVAVSIMGWVHGILFVSYVAVVLGAFMSLGWSKTRTFWSLVASVVPFAPYFVAHREQREEGPTGR